MMLCFWPKVVGAIETNQSLYKLITSGIGYDEGKLIHVSKLQLRNSEFLVFRLKITIYQFLV